MKWYVITQQTRGMQFERSTIVVKVQANSYTEALAKAGAALRLKAAS